MPQDEFTVTRAGQNLAVIEDILIAVKEMLGDTLRPNFRTVGEIILRGVPPEILTRLSKKYWIRDVTDSNTDSAFFLDLLSENSRLLCVLSAVGPFWSVASFEGQSVGHFSSVWRLRPLDHKDPIVESLKEDLGRQLKYCDPNLLSQKVVFDLDENGVDPAPLYKVVFAFGQQLPWWN